ncbi:MULTISPECIES: iron-sulfur cluster carrier protein ApbC [unclassified Aureimonas]|uniref:iron-sulfur cluster carrier protein ApbC n=1 Tax=unclassified Aureimonas TaxID=2615206 RepID=UPI0006FD2BFE|nr:MULTISPECIES: iron-sulfur cluster carrier protein ApbC [unclassified Aureimonas]KQT64200.1 sodium:proton antiporter [Aureimonas sp. Leaf427]KQT81389.1 sodium:proton antiporter [Aureimonas sp. Leaf460]
MSDAAKNAILALLREMPAPDGAGDVVARGLVSDIFIADGKAFFSLTVPAEAAERFEPFRKEVERRVAGVPGITAAMVALTAERAAGSAPQRPAPRPAPAAHSHAHPHPHHHPARPAAPAAPGPRAGSGRPGVPGIDKIVAVASGKGGVGKSTTAVNFALGLQALGLKVGLLDADIYGPSVPRLLGLKGRPETVNGRTMVPLEAFGLKAMSMGFLVEEETPMIWRGPMVMSALTQMLREVEWGKLDVLVVDMPPGTGDAQLTMAQQVPLAGAVIVSTPQDLALLDARKGLAMFRKVEVPVLGIVENMSYFLCPECGTRSDIFGHGGARAEAERLGVPFLGEVPLHMTIRETSDAGRPVVAAEPDGVHAGIFRRIAERALESIADAATARGEGPKIVFES